MHRKILKIALGACLGALVVAQFFRPEKANPPSEPASSFEAAVRPPHQVAAIVKRACRDCHSNETVWPWYSNVSPASWLVAQDVQEGRTHLNLSEWTRFGREKASSRIREMCEQVREGQMPPWYYRPLHPRAGLNQAEMDALCNVRLSIDGVPRARNEVEE